MPLFVRVSLHLTAATSYTLNALSYTLTSACSFRGIDSFHNYRIARAEILNAMFKFLGKRLG